MNPVIETLLNHRSVRRFKDRPLTEAQVRLLVESAQAASTSSYTQSFSIIGVENPQLKEQLRLIAANHQLYVEHNGYFFVFVADQYRNKKIGAARGRETSVLDTMQRLIVALGDASFAAQNLAVAAESMGLGVCYIGSIQNDIDRTTKLLGLPEGTFPIFGLAVGYPDQQPEKKPRLPFSVIFHKNHYQTDIDNRALEAYDRAVRDYYRTRSEHPRDDTWTAEIARGLEMPARMQLKPFLEQQKLGRR